MFNYALMIMYTYSKCYVTYLYNSGGDYVRKMLKSARNGEKVAPTRSYLDEYEMLKKEYEFVQDGRLEFKKLESSNRAHKQQLNSLINLNLTEYCGCIFKYSIENYFYRNISVCLLLIHVIWTLVEMISQRVSVDRMLTSIVTPLNVRRLIFLNVHFLISNLPMFVYVFNMIQYYKLRFKIEQRLLVSVRSDLTCFLAFRDHNPIGYVLVSCPNGDKSNVSEIINVYLLNAYRNMRIGKHMLRSALFYCKLKQPHATVYCAIDADKYHTICFLNKLEFKMFDKSTSTGDYYTFVSSLAASDRLTLLHSKYINYYYLFFKIDLNYFI